MAVPPKPQGHSPAIETLAGKTLADPNATAREKKLAGAILAHADGEPNKPTPKAKPAAKPKPKPAAPKAAPKPKPKK